MKTPLALGIALLLSAILSLGQAPPDSTPPRYSVKNLGASGIGITFGRAINNSGQAVGIAWGPSSFGILYSNSRATLLRPMAGQDASDVHDINDTGIVVGNSNVRILAGLKRTRACKWVGGKVQDLGLLAGDNISDATGINRAGIIVGSSGSFDINDPQKMRSRAVMWVHGKIQALAGISGELSTAEAINNAGTILGMRDMKQPNGPAFFYRAGKVVDLANPAGGRSYVTALNDRDQVVGEGDVKKNVSHALLWSDGKVIDLGTLQGQNESSASDINNRGDVVGYSGRDKHRAFLWRNGHMYDLNGLIPKGSGWVLEMATSVNDRGQVLGHGSYQGKQGAFLLTPR